MLAEWFEELLSDHEAASVLCSLPPCSKAAMFAVARRKGLLDDESLAEVACECLPDDAWNILDVSSTPISNEAFLRAVNACPNLVAVDITGCEQLTRAGVRECLS